MSLVLVKSTERMSSSMRRCFPFHSLTTQRSELAHCSSHPMSIGPWSLLLLLLYDSRYREDVVCMEKMLNHLRNPLCIFELCGMPELNASAEWWWLLLLMLLRERLSFKEMALFFLPNMTTRAHCFQRNFGLEI